MAVAQGSCPNCGAPIEYGLGASLAKVCEYCRATVVRTDRGLENLGVSAALADTPALIAVGDEGTLAGRHFKVFGRVQLDHGLGPWDEYYVAFDYGQTWGWLAFAQGHWYVTALAQGPALPAWSTLQVEQDLVLGEAGRFRVAELKSGSVRSAEGELPGSVRPGQMRYYADAYGPSNAFATLDYGDNSGRQELFTGWVFAETALVVVALGPRSLNKVKTTQIRCPACGGDVPKLSGDRTERLGCPYCGAISDIGTREIVARQEAAHQSTDIPLGSRGRFEDVEYVCIAYVRRCSYFEGERYSWEEYLLWSQGVGFRWVVKDPETGWIWVVPVNLADIDLGALPKGVGWGGRRFRLRNQNRAHVEYVLGEVYWKCVVGEATEVSDFVDGRDVLSREASPGEVQWSYSTPLAWPLLAQAFGVPPNGPGAHFDATAAGGSSGGGRASTTLVLFLILAVILILCALSVCGDGDGGVGGFRGGGIYYGGK